MTARLEGGFTKRNCRAIGLSVNPASSHGKWAVDIGETQRHRVNFPMIRDPELQVAKLYDIVAGRCGAIRRRAAWQLPTRPCVRCFSFGPDKKIKLMLIYPMTTGRNFDDVTDCGAQSGDAGQLEARRRCHYCSVGSRRRSPAEYPGEFKTIKPHLRVVSQPT